jgi:organic hydroperoxide reductase OsmC/OhrA
VKKDGTSLFAERNLYVDWIEGKPAARRAAEETSSLMKAAHEVCPYSNATRGNIDVRLVAE